jgi:hypothetical protein
MGTIRRARLSARNFVLSFSAALFLLAGAASAAEAAQSETPSDRLQVWNLNTHGMDTGLGSAPNNAPPPRTDYRDFISYIIDPARVAYFPDVVTLQETGTNDGGVVTASCTDFAFLVQLGTGHPYSCAQTTKTGGAAIVFRSDRLTLLASNPDVRLKRVVNPENQGPGEQLGDCLVKNWRALVLLMQDKRDTSKYLSAESVHLPTADYTDSTGTHDCVWENMQITNQAVNNAAAKMQIMAGDWNHVDAAATGTNQDTFQQWECWYEGVNTALSNCGGQDLGWRDGIYESCLGASNAATYACLHPAHGTYVNSSYPNTKRRIDFLFAKASAIYNPVTVWWSDAYASAVAAGQSGGPTEYSDHRGQGALLKYN